MLWNYAWRVLGPCLSLCFGHSCIGSSLRADLSPAVGVWIAEGFLSARSEPYESVRWRSICAYFVMTWANKYAKASTVLRFNLPLHSIWRPSENH
eukprot:5084144-Amphidinium_carterae.1